MEVKTKYVSQRKVQLLHKTFFPGANSLFYFSHAESLYISLLSTEQGKDTCCEAKPMFIRAARDLHKLILVLLFALPHLLS